MLLTGMAALAVAVMTGAGMAAVRATSSTALRAVERRPARLGRVLSFAPLPAVIGASLALDRGRGERSLPVRPAIGGAVAGVLGIVAALGLVHGIDDALARLERSGQIWAAEYFSEERTVDEVAAALGAEPEVDEIFRVRRVNVDIEGAGLPVYTLERVRGRSAFALLRGRAPAAPDEAAIGPSTARALGRHLGDTIRAGEAGRPLRVVGIVLLPQTPHSSFDQGLWMTAAGLAAVAGAEFWSPDITTVAVNFRAGTDVVRVAEELSGRFGLESVGTGVPQDVLLLRNVRTLPKALAALLALLGLAALWHALVTAVRRRRHDLAVLRAVGFRPFQVGGCIVWQATSVAVVAVLAGIPLGIVVGRSSWRWIADATPLLYVAPIALGAVLLILPASLLLANALAAVPARRAWRLRAAEVLRTE